MCISKHPVFLARSRIMVDEQTPFTKHVDDNDDGCRRMVRHRSSTLPLVDFERVLRVSEEPSRVSSAMQSEEDQTPIVSPRACSPPMSMEQDEKTKMRAMVATIDRLLYKTAPDVQTYTDRTTLQPRLKALYQSLVRRKERKAGRVHKASSSRTRSTKYYYYPPLQHLNLDDMLRKARAKSAMDPTTAAY